MPDWFYRTISQPLLFRLPAPRARALALGFMGRLARLPGGPALIDFLGHMRPDARLRQHFLDLEFPVPLGLGPWLDAEARALPALARFGIGFLEIGPVTLAGQRAATPLARAEAQGALWYPDPPGALSLATVQPRLVELARLGRPRLLRLGYPAGATAATLAAHTQRLIHALAPHAELFVLATLPLALAERWPLDQWEAHLRDALEAAGQHTPARPLLVALRPEIALAVLAPFVERALQVGVVGVVIDGSVPAPAGGRWVGAPARAPVRALVQALRERWGARPLLVASGGVHEPDEALALYAAGADLVQLDSGLVYSGPGLPKRIGAALLYEATRALPAPEREARPAEESWFWCALMGLGMLIGSVMALLIAATRVVLPYDEQFVGTSRQALAALNPQLLPFMAHNRISLAGAMVALGVMYVALSLFGIRRGQQWAQQALFISALTGFASFFLFLGFGYLDPFHAFVSAILFQFLLFGVHARLGPYIPARRPAGLGDRAWRLSLWGQWLLILHGAALLVAGSAISAIGVGQVFVAEDLAFMGTAAETLLAVNPRLVPLVAHDRATFGGMLLASGWVLLLPSLWGFERGAAWLWWAFLLAGAAAYGAVLGVHYAVGYLSLVHLLPAFAGLLLLALGLLLAYPFLCDKSC